MTPAAHLTRALPSLDHRRAVAAARRSFEASLPGGRLLPTAGVRVVPPGAAVPLLVALARRVHSDRETAHADGVRLLQLVLNGRAWWALLTASQRKLFIFSTSGRLCALGDLFGPGWGAPVWRREVEHHHWY